MYSFICLLLFSSATWLFCKEPSKIDLLKPTLNQQALLIHASVNVITGDFIQNEKDLDLPGPRPIKLSRRYSSGNEHMTALQTGWAFDLFSWCSLYRVGKGSFFHRFSPENQILYFTQNGGIIRTARQKIDSCLLNYSLNPSEEGYQGLCYSAIYKGGNHPKNMTYKVIDPDKKALKGIIITEGNGQELCFHSNKTFLYEKFNLEKTDEMLLLPLDRVIYPSGHYDLFERDTHQNEIPSFLTIAFKGASHELYGDFTFKQDPNDLYLKAFGSNGRKINYRFSKIKEHSYLSTVEAFAKDDKTPFYKIDYEYKPVSQSSLLKMSQKSESDGRFLKINYYDKGLHYKDPRIGKVKSLHGKEGRLFSFFYDEKPAKQQGEGHTLVLNSNGHRTAYLYKNNRLTDIIESLNKKPYFATTFKWTDDKSVLPGLLTKKEIIDFQNKRRLLSHTYSYDTNGNLLKETFAGHLTGNGSSSDSKTYSYQNSGKAKNLLHTVTTLRNQTTIFYQENTDLVKALYVKGDSFQKRQFYTYDENHVLIETIEDDGLNDDSNDLRGVTYRKRVTIELKKGMPSTTIEAFWNSDSQSEELSLKTDITYNLDGQPVNRKVYTFDTDWVLAEERYWEYDAAGRSTLECDPEGIVTTYEYNELGSVIKEERASHQKWHLYDLFNRRIQTTHKSDGVPDLIESWTYDAAHNKKTQTNIYGNTTYYTYDELNRLKSITETPTKPQLFTYDVLDYKTSKTNSNGFVTKYTHNIRGQPTVTIYPDGTQEKRTYTVDGLLEKESYADGLVISTTYDAFSRITSKEWLHNENSLKTEKFLYNAYFLLAKTEQNERVTTYKYNHKGLLIEERQGDKRTTYRYDGLGRTLAIRRFASRDTFVEEQMRYNRLGQVILSFEIDELGRMTKEKKNTYNPFGQLLSIQEGDAMTTFAYDAIGSLTSVIDPNGAKSVKTNDSLGRVALQEFFDPYGKLVQKEVYSYDANGNKTSQTTYFFIDDNCQKQVVDTFEFDKKNRLIKQTKALGTAEEKITQVIYDSMGRKTSIITDEVTFFTYNPLGQLIEKRGDTFSESYVYDPLGRLTEIKNNLTGKTTKRWYDLSDNMIKECLESGLTLKRSFDFLGRPTMLTLPDQSSISYVYGGSKLQRINRLGKRCYTHRYAYDEKGRLIAERLPLKGQNIKHEYDKASNWSKTTHPHLTQEALGYDSHNNLLGIHLKNALGDEESLKKAAPFSYDPFDRLPLIEEDLIALEVNEKVYLPLYTRFGHLALILDGDTGKPVQYYRRTLSGECQLYDTDGEQQPLTQSIYPPHLLNRNPTNID